MAQSSTLALAVLPRMSSMGSLSSGVAGALAVMVDDDDGQVVAQGHLLEGGVDLASSRWGPSGRRGR